MKRIRPLLILLGSLGLAVALRATVSCPVLFTDHMVLQREQPVRIWGEAAAGEQVTVEFAGQHHETVTPADGHWQVFLDPMAASAEPRTLTIRGHNTLRFTDVLVGEVWVCAGQSNMGKPLGPRKGQRPTNNYQEAIREANHPQLRLFKMPWYGRPKQGVIGLRWVRCTPETVAGTQFSAAGYYFGRKLLRTLDVPVGLIQSSFGGTQIEAWIPKEGFAADPALRGLEKVRYPAWVKGVQATDLYHSMVVPLEPYTVRGFIWYQGESNVMEAQGPIYAHMMRALIRTWRAGWQAPDAPFYYVEIAPFDYSKWDKFPRLETPEALPVFWEAQTSVLSLPHTGMIATTDLVKDMHDIHPTDKLDVGRRLARLALSETYGRHGLLAQSPRYAAMRRLSGGRIEITFKHCGMGLTTREGGAPDWFTLAGADRHFVPATATITGPATVVLSSPQVPDPVAARLGWNELANPNLVNSVGLPAIPFRTDDWPVKIERPHTKPVHYPVN